MKTWDELGEAPNLMQSMNLLDDKVMRYGDKGLFTKSTQVLTLFRHRLIQKSDKEEN